MSGEEVETGASDSAPAISNELKSIVQAGDDDRPTSNPKSLGYGIQQIKLEYWDPENEKYWDVSQLIFLLTSFFSMRLHIRISHNSFHF